VYVCMCACVRMLIVCLCMIKCVRMCAVVSRAPVKFVCVRERVCVCVCVFFCL